MFLISAIVLHVFITAGYVDGRDGVGEGEQDWGYITVRPNAHMFWWLFYTTCNDVSSYTERPLIIWLQGGPGMPSSGYGNFLEIGPLQPSFDKREGSFVENFNVLFVDNPVGVGYSYISDENTTLVTNGAEIGADLYSFLKTLITEHHPEFEHVPIYIFGESYGGKMAVELAYALKENERKENVTFCNITGIALGDAYISPVDYLMHYGSLAYSLGLVDKRGFTLIDDMAKQTQNLINNKKFEEAASLENILISAIVHSTPGIDVHNILEKTNTTKYPKVWDSMLLLEDMMNGEVREKLNISKDIFWNYFQNDLYHSLRGDFIKSVTDKVEILLNTTDLKIIVYNGVLDFIVNTAGTRSWLDNLNWQGRKRWLNEDQTAILIDGVSEGYYKRVDNLSFYVILRAGHSVPMDNLAALNKIVQAELLG